MINIALCFFPNYTSQANRVQATGHSTLASKLSKRSQELSS